MPRLSIRRLAAPLAVGLALCLAGPSSGLAERPAQSSKPLFVGFYVGWDAASRRSLAAHVASLDVFAPLWLTIRGPKAEVVAESDPGARKLLAARTHPPRVFPILSNAHDDEWDTAAADAAILDPQTRDAVFTKLTDLARTQGYSGYIFDFENLSTRAAAAYPAFLAAARAALTPAKAETWATEPIGSDQSQAALSAATDTLVLMAYDECWTTSTPGPIAGEDWLEQALRERMAGLDPAHVVVALGSYGYDWPQGAAASVVTAGAAQQTAARSGAAVTRAPPSRNPNFGYADARGRRHTVWFLDATAFAMQSRAALAWRPRGVALWRLGLEDPALWVGLGGARVGAPRPPAVRSGPAPHPCDPMPGIAPQP